MKVTDLLKDSSDQITVSFEVIPSSKGLTRSKLIEDLKPFMEFNPLFIDVTTHRNKVDIKSVDGELILTERHRYVSTLPICNVIADKFGVEVVPHIMCGNYTKQDTEEFLIDAAFYGFDNLFVVRGDKLLYEKTFTPNPKGNKHASDLLMQISDFNNGKVLDESIQYPGSHKFCLGACCYPETHIESPNQREDIHHTKMRVMSGAEFLISQMFFENQKFYNLQEALPGIPVIPGIKVLTNIRQYWTLPGTFGVKIPNSLFDNSEHIDEDELGKDFCVRQCKDLIDHGVKHLHFFTMNNKAVLDVLKSLF